MVKLYFSLTTPIRSPGGRFRPKTAKQQTAQAICCTLPCRPTSSEWNISRLNLQNEMNPVRIHGSNRARFLLNLRIELTQPFHGLLPCLLVRQHEREPFQACAILARSGLPALCHVFKPI